VKRRDPEPLPEAPPPEVRRAQESRLIEVWKTPRGWRYWSAVNNSVVGLWYTAAAFGFFLFAGVLALTMRVQLAIPNNDLLTASQYDQFFTMHGTIMMFLFAVPVFEAFSILVLPQMLGARDLPFPRLSAYGFWCYLIGGTFVCGSIFFGAAPTAGWFMYPPLTTDFTEGYGTEIWLLGLSFIEVASIAAAVELLVGILKCRPPGMRIHLIPLYAWYILVVAVMILFAFPPLIAGDLLMELDTAFDWPFFDPERGGDPLLWQHLFWIFGHPEVYIVFLPSIALVATMVPTFARIPMVGYTWVVLSAIGTGFISFGLWVHHMFTTGLPGVSLAVFSAASQAVAIPTGVQIFCFIATLLAGRVRMSVPMLFILGGLSTFVIGGLTGVMVALLPFDLQAHDNYFVVGHLHSVLIGGTIFPVIGAFYYYFPLIGERPLSDRLGKISFWLMLIGFNVAFLPMHLTGLVGMPRRVYTYAPDLGFDELNLVSTIGAFVLAAGILVFVVDVLRPKQSEPYSPRNPWQAGGLEWMAEMPDKPWGIRSIPEIDGRYPLWDQPNLMRDIDEGRFFLPDAEEMLRETIVTSPVDATPTQVQRVAGPTFVTIAAAVATGGFFILSTFHMWWLAVASGLLAVVAIVAWLWTGTAHIPAQPQKYVGLGVTLPTYVSGPSSVGWWAMLITMLGDFTAYAGLVFGYFFYWTVNDDFPPPLQPDPTVVWALGCGALALAAWGATVAAIHLNRADRGLAYHLTLGAGVLAAAGTAAAMVFGLRQIELDPTIHVYGAIVWALVIWVVAHLALGAVMQLYCLARRAAGRMTARYDMDIHNVALYWHFTGPTALVTLAVLAGFPVVA
jgi:cytochrome c oxidase subunit I+III